MKIAFATAALPDTGTAVVFAADGALGATAADLDRRAGGALSRAIELAGGKLKRGRAVELLCPAGVGLGRVVVLGVGTPGEAKRLDLEVLGGSLAVRLKALGVAEASVALDAIDGLPFGPAELAVSLAEGAMLRSYRFEKYRTRKEEDEDGQD
ncbi:MAG: M17 family peptidase N-terminal domain-containing protein, partial [Geminicoccaceae bacterium]